MKRELEYFFAALRFFTRLPVPRWVGHTQDQLDHAARYFPLIGILIGAIGAGVTELAALALPIGAAVLLGMAATILATGAFHEDGFADSCDGFGGGWDKAQVLAIMKDSRVGSYATLGVGLMLLAKWNGLVELDAAFGPPLLAIALVAGHAVSRLASTLLIFFLEYARDDDSSKSKPLAQRMAGGELAIAATIGLAPCLLLPPIDALVALAAVALAALLAARYFVRRIGGYTGDCLGAVQQVCELAFYLGLLCSFT
ncbi:adenosylcobinamide-GDP ribazoletransferase [Sulfuritalea hydrogenivorans]|uniref:Adenosylcobinamide-GDP ribazoletransferase n=1 Tax=Sulfuritalea hydrogenivorans sk43H TaxID=1223802 RepID=W0SGJ2_9PROT|nr:adenosylcobinamide-GDP ribazoletransferase [Sulfuritalea hydrogenivorans]BAO30404.1 cobalamin synthase [Sulfuritalea hydrogenivorans sk43H]